jgi:hypothetical protein
MADEFKSFDDYDKMNSQELAKELSFLVENKLINTEAYRMIEAIAIKREKNGKKQTQEEIEVPNEAKIILQNPALFNEITEIEFDKKIVGEIETRKVILLCAAGGSKVKNAQTASYNLLVNDDAGVGKDYVVYAVLEILPKDIYIHKTRISPMVFTYWHNPKFEPDWTWCGKIFYPEDISESVLNSDVFKVMCSKGSSATVVIKQKAYEIDIQGKPVMITTTTSATPNPELTRRFVILNLDSSEDQTKAVMKRHSEFKKKGIVPEYDPKYAWALGYLKQVKVRIPFAEIIDQYFPTKNIIMRTNYPRFLDFVSASAAFHQYQREVDEEGYVLAVGQDYDIARACFLKLTSNRYMIPLTINQKKILAEFEKNKDLIGSASALHSTNMSFLSLPALQTNLGILVKYGILRIGILKDQWNRDIEVYSLSGAYLPDEHFEIPKYNELTLTPLQPKLPLIPLIPLTPQENEVGTKATKGIKPIKDIQNPIQQDILNWLKLQTPNDHGHIEIGTVEDHYPILYAVFATKHDFTNLYNAIGALENLGILFKPKDGFIKLIPQDTDQEAIE